MFAFIPLPLLVLSIVSYVHAQASLTPPPLSESDSVTLSLSFTPTTTSFNASSTSTGNHTSTQTSSAQFPSLSGLSQCANTCLALAISQDGCNSIVEVNCYCANSTKFASDLVTCISAQCPNDLSMTESIAQQFCALASTSTSISFPTAPPSTSFSNPFSSTSSSRPLSSSNSTATSPAQVPTSPPSDPSNNNGAARALPSLGGSAAMAGAIALGSAVMGILLA